MRIMLHGCGYWGEKLGQTLTKVNSVDCVGFYDQDETKAVSLFEKVSTEKMKYVVKNTRRELLDFDAVVIATPSYTHYEIAKQCLEAGKHVLVEKPMTLDYAQAAELVELAQSKKLTLMTDSTFLYSNAILNLSRFFPNKEGVIVLPRYNLDLTWTGKRYGNTPEGILWTYGPHPVSIALALMKSPGCFTDITREGTELRLSLLFSGDRTANIVLDWDVPVRRRELLISEYNRLRWINLISPNATNYEQVDPLTNMCKKFLQRVSNQEPFIDYNGLEVVRVLEEAEKRLKEKKGASPAD